MGDAISKLASGASGAVKKVANAVSGAANTAGADANAAADVVGLSQPAAVVNVAASQTPENVGNTIANTANQADNGINGEVNTVDNGVNGAVNTVDQAVNSTGNAVAAGVKQAADGLGQALGDLSAGTGAGVSGLGQVPVADQTALNNQVALNNALSTGYQGGQTAQQALANTTNAQALGDIRGASQNAINSAQNVNVGVNGNVNNSLGLVGQTAAGGGAAQQAAAAQLQAGTNQAIASQHALANSGNLSQMISGQKTAMDNAAGLQQTNALNAASLQANMAGTAQNAYTSAAANQASNANTAAGLQQNQAAQTAALGSQANQQAANYAGAANTALGTGTTGATNALGLKQGAYTATGQNQALIAGGALNALGGIVSLSDEDTKNDIEYASGPSAGTPLNSSNNSSTATAADDNNDVTHSNYTPNNWINSSTKTVPWSVIQSDKKEKKDISDKKDKVAAFLDAIDPVSFKYKKQDGQMGRTPGEHIGVIAQQIEKAPGGKSMIVETPEGKGIDLASAVGTLLAAAAESHDRIKDLEDLFKSKGKK